MNALTPHQIMTLSASELAAQPSAALFQLRNDAADLLSAAKAIAEHIDRALSIKYTEQAHQLRLAAGKDTGIVHFNDGSVRISAELSKKVEWDQKQLALIAQRIAENGENPAEYIELTYKVSESKYNAWPETIRTAFSPARTLKPGKPSFRLARLED